MPTKAQLEAEVAAVKAELRAVDALFCWQPAHCYHSWRAEWDRRQLPSHYR